MTYTLMPHQQRTVDRLLKDKRLLMWADAGTGKTLVAIDAALKTKRPVIVIAPRFLENNWRAELEKWGVDSKDYRFYSHHEVRQGKLPPVMNSLLVIDECHFAFGNTQSKTYKAFVKWHDTFEPRYTLLLSGTPIRTKPSEIYGQLKLVGYDECRSVYSFKELYVRMEPLHPGSPYMQETGVLHAPSFRKMLMPFVERVKLAEVLTLEPLVSQAIDLELKEDKLLNELAKCHDADELARAMSNNARGIETKLTIAKVKATAIVKEGFLDTLAGPVIIFSDHPDALDILVAGCKEPHGVINAKTPPEVRAKIADAYQQGKFDRLYINIRCGGVGLNLQRAQYVVFNDLAYTPADNRQALARAYRQGRTGTLVVYKIFSGYHDKHLGTLLTTKRCMLTQVDT